MSMEWTVAELVVAGLRYRPNWWFTSPLPNVVRMHFDGPNSLRPEETITLKVDVNVYGMDIVEALDKVYDRIADVEAHERAEWATFHGYNINPEARRAHPGMYPPIDRA